MADYDSEAGETEVKERPSPISAPAPTWLEGATLSPDTRSPLQPEPPRQSLEDMTRPPQALIDLQTRRAGDMEAERKKQSGILDQDQAEMHRRFAQTGIEPGTLEPWDNNKQREKYRTDPIESFGSLGSVFAMVASAFTRAPMENALNGAASAMNAVKAGNDQEFQLAHRAWKENNDLALKRHDIMQQQYDNAIKLMSSDVTAGHAKMAMLASSYDDQQLLGLLNAGLWPQGLELLEKRNKIAKDQFEISDRMNQAAFQRQALKVSLENNKQIEDPAKRALQNLVEFNRIYGVKEQTPQQAIFATYMVQHPNATVEEIADFAQKHGLLPRQFSGGNAATEQRMRLAEETIQQFEGSTGEKLDPAERNMIQQAFQDKTSSGSLKTAALMSGLEDIQARKASGEKVTAEDRSRILKEHADRGESLRIKQEELKIKQDRFAQQQQQMETGHLSDAAIDRMARQFVEAGDVSVKTNIGTGASRGENLGRLNQRIADLQIEQNVSPKEQFSRIAKAGGEKQYQRTTGGYGGRVEVASNEVVAMIPLALASSEKMKRSKYVPINQVMQIAQRGSSNLDLMEFATNNFGLTNAYVRAMNPTGVPRVQERLEAHMEGLFRTVTSHEAYDRMVKQMAREVEASKNAVQAARDEKSLEAELTKIINAKPRTDGAPKGAAGSSLGGSRSDGPPIGTIDGGYRFKGGANVKENWEKL